MGYERESDARLVQRARGDDREAFDELIKRHHENVRAQCLAITRDPEEAEDRAQETFMRAYQAIGGFRSEARFSTWLYAIARNACLMQIRKRKLRTMPLDRTYDCGGESVQLEVADPAGDASSPLLRAELRRTIRRLIGRLSPLNRTVFELRLVQGLSTAETGRVLGLSGPAVKSRLHMARLVLREGLSPYLKEGLTV
jgi:RNA polymerase sigma-70 factor (ECF subfamily)